MQLHPYIGLRATRPASTNPRLPEVSGIIVAVGTESEELEVSALHFTGAVLLLDDGKHKEVPLDSLIVDPAEASARMAPPVVERWMAVALVGGEYGHPLDLPPVGWEPVGIWEPVDCSPAAPGQSPTVLWKRPLRRVTT